MHQYDLIVRGRIVMEHGTQIGEIGISDGKIMAVSLGAPSLNGKRIEDFGEAYVFPGFIDTHVHCFSNPDEGIVPTSLSAAAGGITTFFDMPYDLPNPISNAERFREKVRRVESEAVVDMCLWGTITKRGGTDDILPLAEAGAAAFKMSTFETDPYRFPRIPDREIMRALELIAGKGLVASFHAENDEIIADLIEEYTQLGKVYPRAHMETRPPLTETTAVLKLLEIAHWVKAKLHIVHVSHPRTVQLIQWYRSMGTDATCETCYPYLLLDVHALDKFGPIAKNNPPLREPEHVAGLWEHLLAGEIDFITSDHVPWPLASKEKGNDNIFLATSGLPGLEVIVPLMFDAAVASGRMTPSQFAKVMAQNPAEVYGIRGKGKVSPGYDADLVVIDHNRSYVIDENEFRSQSKRTPFHGAQVRGKIVHTFLRGQVVYDGMEVTVEPGFGKFVPGAAYKA